MNGYGSQRRVTAAAFTITQMITTTVCPRMYCGVPKKRAILSAIAPNLSAPKAPCRSAWAAACFA